MLLESHGECQGRLRLRAGTHPRPLIAHDPDSNLPTHEQLQSKIRTLSYFLCFALCSLKPSHTRSRPHPPSLRCAVSHPTATMLRWQDDTDQGIHGALHRMNEYLRSYSLLLHLQNHMAQRSMHQWQHAVALRTSASSLRWAGSALAFLEERVGGGELGKADGAVRVGVPICG